MFNIFRFLYLFAKVVKNLKTTKYIMIKNVNAIKIISGSRIKSITTYQYLYRSLQCSRRSLFQCHYFFPGLPVPFPGFQFFILFIVIKFIEPIIPMDAVIVVFDNPRTSVIYLYLVCKTTFLTITCKQ